jgi:hypothetical protein
MFTFVPVRTFLDDFNRKNITYRVCYTPTKRYMFITYVCNCFETEPKIVKNNNILVRLLYYQAITWENSCKSFERDNDNHESLTFVQWCFWKRQVITLKKVMVDDYSFFVSCKILYRHTYYCNYLKLDIVLFINEIISNVGYAFPAHDRNLSVHKASKNNYEMCLSLYLESHIGKHTLKLLHNLVDNIVLSVDTDDFEIIAN